MMCALLAATLGCRAGDPASQPAQDRAAETPRPPVAQQSSRALESLDVCALVPAKEVGDALGEPLDPRFPSKGESTEVASNCWYWILPRGSSSGAAEPYIVWVTTPALYDPEAENAEPVAGLGDEAKIRFDKGEDQYRLTVLRRGDFALEVIGQERERTRRLADLVLSRLGTR
jgi:hypothetical protein